MSSDVPAEEVASSLSRFYRPVREEATPEAYRHFWQLWSEKRFFECHEVLEELWRETIGERRLFYNGLIHCAVALHQHQNGNAEGAARQLVRAQVKLQKFVPEYSGVDVAELLAIVEHEIASSLGELSKRQRARLPRLRRTVSERIGNETGSQAEE